MIKFLMQKTIYKNETPEAQEMLWKLLSRQHIIELLCALIIPFNFLLTFIPVIIIELCDDVQLSILTQILVCSFEIIYALGIVFAFKYFTQVIIVCTHMVSWKIYYFLYTRKGKALEKCDFKTIKSKSENLFDFISSERCRGYCYSICFNMLKLLQKGHMEYVAIRNLIHDDDEDDEEKQKQFTMHALYVNNGWAFDTYCQRQFPIEELLKIYNAKVFKTFSFNDIKDVSYDDFRRNLKDELHSWCIHNDCYETFGEGLEEN